MYKPVAALLALMAFTGCSGSTTSEAKNAACPAISDAVVMPEGEITCVVIEGQRIMTAAMWNVCPNGDRVYRLNTSVAQGWWLSTDGVFHLEPLNGPAELAACGSASTTTM